MFSAAVKAGKRKQTIQFLLVEYPASFGKGRKADCTTEMRKIPRTIPTFTLVPTTDYSFLGRVSAM